MNPKSRLRDLRKYSRQSQFRFIFGGILIILIIGLGLIYRFYGSSAAVSGLVCLLGVFIVPVSLIVISLWIIDWIVKRANRQ